jgi:hypothetical protein
MASKPRSLMNKWAGTDDEDKIFKGLWETTGLVGADERLPSGDKGFNVSKLMRRTGQQYVGGQKVVEEGDGDGYGVVRMPNWVEGWAKHVERTYGHRNAFAALSAWGGSINKLVDEYAEDDMKDAESILGKVATRLSPDNEDSFKTMSGREVKSPITGGIGSDPQGLISATPIMIDPDLVNTVRSQAPILDWVDVVAQGGFTASYNIVSGREAPSHGWSTEAEVRDVSDSSGSAFTLTNDDEDMRIWLDVLDISDFASRAMSSLDFMDLEGTSVEVRSQEYAIQEAEALLYGDPNGGLSDGSAHDSEAPKGLYSWADDANTSYTIDRSSYDLTGDKPLFEDIKSYVRGLLKNTAATPGNLGIVVSPDMFDALENEANVNVRLDAFDGTLNFGRQAGANTLSITGVPVLPDPNVRDHAYGSGEYDGNIGDVFIYERPRFQRRALMPFSSTTFGQDGLANRMGLFQYEATVDKTQGEHVRVLENYNIPAVSDT